MDVIAADPRRNIYALRPLSEQTQATLSQYIFARNPGEEQAENLSQAACAAYQSFAVRVSSLLDLQRRLQEGEIDLGWKDKAWAIAACVATAALAAAVVYSTLNLMLVAGMIFGGYFFHAGFANIVYLIDVGTAVALPPVFFWAGFKPLIKAVRHAREVFSRPTPQQMQEQLDRFAVQEIAGDDLVQTVITRLTQQIEQVNQQREEAEEPQASVLRDKIDALQAAQADLQRLKLAIWHRH